MDNINGSNKIVNFESQDSLPVKNQPHSSLRKEQQKTHTLALIIIGSIVGGIVGYGLTAGTGGLGLAAIPIGMWIGGKAGLGIAAIHRLFLYLIKRRNQKNIHFNEQVQKREIGIQNGFSLPNQIPHHIVEPLTGKNAVGGKTEKEMKKEKAEKMCSEIHLLQKASGWTISAGKNGFTDEEFAMAWTYDQELQAVINPLYNQIRSAALQKEDHPDAAYPIIGEFDQFKLKFLEMVIDGESKWLFTQALSQIEKTINQLNASGQLDPAMDISDFIQERFSPSFSSTKILYEKYSPYKESQKVYLLACKSDQEIIMNEVQNVFKNSDIALITDEEFEITKNQAIDVIQKMVNDSIEKIEGLENQIAAHTLIEKELIGFIRDQMNSCIRSIKFKAVKEKSHFQAVPTNLESSLSLFQKNCKEKLKTYDAVKGEECEQLRDYYEQIIEGAVKYTSKGMYSKIKTVNNQKDLIQENAAGKAPGLKPSKNDAFDPNRLDMIFSSTDLGTICGLKGDAFLNVMDAKLYRPGQVMRQLQAFFRFYEEKRQSKRLI